MDYYPPDTSFLFLIMVALFYYPISASLERTWGSFRFTLYILSGMIFTVISAFVLYFMTKGRKIIFQCHYLLLILQDMKMALPCLA